MGSFVMGWQALGHSFQKIYNICTMFKLVILPLFKSITTVWGPIEWVENQLNGLFRNGVECFWSLLSENIQQAMFKLVLLTVYGAS